MAFLCFSRSSCITILPCFVLPNRSSISHLHDLRWAFYISPHLPLTLYACSSFFLILFLIFFLFLCFLFLYFFLLLFLSCSSLSSLQLPNVLTPPLPSSYSTSPGCLFIFVGSWIVDRSSLKNGLLLAAASNLFGCWIRAFAGLISNPTGAYWTLLVGAAVTSLGQATFLIGPPKVDFPLSSSLFFDFSLGSCFSPTPFEAFSSHNPLLSSLCSSSSSLLPFGSENPNAC
jgi:hypothetical protein